MRIDHRRECDHPATPAARAACRKQRAESPVQPRSPHAVTDVLAAPSGLAHDVLQAAPDGIVRALGVLVHESRQPASRYARLSWLASPAGSTALGALKDAVVVDARMAYPADTYADTGSRLGITKAAVNAAVARHNRRTHQHPGGTR